MEDRCNGWPTLDGRTCREVAVTVARGGEIVLELVDSMREPSLFTEVHIAFGALIMCIMRYSTGGGLKISRTGCLE